MRPEEPLRIEVVYAWPEEQVVVQLSVPRGTTARQAFELSGLSVRYPEIGSAASSLGIYGRVVTGDTVLCDADRIEIYRPLVADPKLVRRRRAAEKR
jgi:putative ubiquitin-RnfH superfamily antitoxin RatB of RatAB toxin-antitoxin module